MLNRVEVRGVGRMFTDIKVILLTYRASIGRCCMLSLGAARCLQSSRALALRACMQKTFFM